MKFVPELGELLKSEGSPALAAKVLGLARPGIHIAKRYETTLIPQPAVLGLIKRKPKPKRTGLVVGPGASRLGGLPELPDCFPWPVVKGKPLQFLAQVNCAEIAMHREQTLLPPAGTLHFFYNEAEQDSSVSFTTDGVVLKPAPAPAGVKTANFILPQFPVEFLPIPTFPDSSAKEFAPLNSDEQEAEAFFEAHAKWCKEYLAAQYGENGALHQIGGYPKCIQGDVRAEFEMYANRHIASTDKKLWEEAAQNAGRWRLLLQFDTDDDVKVMWGDAGTLFFCIREDDLKAGRFEATQATVQCY